jgi:hypothetical protein
LVYWDSTPQNIGYALYDLYGVFYATPACALNSNIKEDNIYCPTGGSGSGDIDLTETNSLLSSLGGTLQNIENSILDLQESLDGVHVISYVFITLVALFCFFLFYKYAINSFIKF